MPESKSGALPDVGGVARFIRWHRNHDGGWYPEVLHGRYQDITLDGWTVLVDGDLKFLASSEWSIYWMPGRRGRF